MTFYKSRQSKYSLSAMEVGESRTFDTPAPGDKRRIRRSAHNMNTRTDRYYVTRTQRIDTLMITRIR